MKTMSEATSNIMAALKAWSSGTTDGLLDDWLLVQEVLSTLPEKNTVETRRLATNTVLLAAFDKLKVRNPEPGEILRERFQNGKKQKQVCRQLSISPATLNRRQTLGVDILTGILLEQEAACRAARHQQLLSTLKNIGHIQCFGIETIQQVLAEKLIDTNAPFQMLIGGIGGIGKSTLADSIARTVAATLMFQHIVWIYVPLSMAEPRTHSELEALLVTMLSHYISQKNSQLLTSAEIKHWLQAHRTLIVIDNIEDKQDAQHCLQITQDWINPSKVVVTSRVIPELNHVYLHPVHVLSREHSYALIRNVAGENNQTQLLNAHPDTLATIFDRTGGNPHAIKMIVGMAASMPLSIVLQDIPEGGFEETQTLYQYIYQRVWAALSAEAQQLLLMMPMFIEHGATYDEMREVTGFETVPLWSAIKELQTRSLLLAANTTLDNLNFTIHRLTDQFLQVDILAWRN